ncbi:DUF2971 domain-containing protein [Azotobacter vinelandii]|uniref:DUF2971 domain-containing protein n=1 Tax=Azotobacter vinelandii TaxID=354 RepID=UPI0009EA2874|nr:DUF2971 domain-containing protein [Azotobacter vinelandii]
MDREWVKQLIEKFSVPTINELDVPALLDIKRTNIPSQLFKIKACNEHAFDNLAKKTLYLSIANDFNDPYDTAFWGSYTPIIAEEIATSLGLSNDEREKALGESEQLRAIYESAIRKGIIKLDTDIESYINFAIEKNRNFQSEQLAWLVNQLKNSYKICSLSERLDSVVMWSHYGLNHTGFAMEYNFTNLHRNHISILSLWPVAYTDSLFDITQIFLAQRKSSVGFNNLFGVPASLCKAKDWQYEREWRLVVPDGQETNGLSLSAPLKAVHLGARISKSNEEKVRNICRSINIPVFKMRLATHEYRMLSESTAVS